MSAFGNIAILSKPTSENKDWAFEMEGLAFEVHDGMVELQQNIKDFDQFCSSMESLMGLIDNIDWNQGKLDKAVYAFVNQNNELAEALGIITPYSFATEEEQAAAGQEVKAAVQENNNAPQAAAADDKKQGFFARAWEAIKKFFKSIGSAIAKAWRAITGQGEQGTDNAVKALTETVNSAEPSKLDEAFRIELNETAHQGIKFNAKEIELIEQSLAAVTKSIQQKYPSGSFSDIFAIVRSNGDFVDENAINTLLTALHYTADDQGNIKPIEVEKSSQRKSLFDYDITADFCKGFETQHWTPIKQQINQLEKVISAFTATYGKISNADLEKFIVAANLKDTKLVKIVQANFDKPKRGISAKFNRGLGRMKQALGRAISSKSMMREGAKQERTGYTLKSSIMSASEPKDAKEYAAVMASAGQIAVTLLNNLLRITQIALKDLKSFVSSVDSTIKQVTNGLNKKAANKAIQTYNKDFYDDQAEKDAAASNA